MFHLGCFFLIPLIAVAVAGRNRSGARSFVFAAARYAAFALVIAQITAITMIPLDRAEMRVMWNGRGGVILYVSYGMVACMAACLIAVAAGLLSRWQTAKCRIYAHILKKPRMPHVSVSGVLVHMAAFVMLFLTTSYAWALGNFGNVGFAEIEFHMRVPLGGTSSEMVNNYLMHGLLPAVGWMLLLEALVFFPSRKGYRLVSGKEERMLVQIFPLRVTSKMAAAGLALWFVFLLVGFSDSFGVVKYIANRMMQSPLIEEEYVDPRSVQIVFPEEKRNLITIYVESAETTSMDKANGGIFDVNYMPEMTRIARENISFSHSDKLEGAAIAPACGWTIAGLVAETSGLPLRLYVEQGGREGVDNRMDKFSIFMPGATTLGDILKQEGYRTMFMCGSDLTFGGRRVFYTEHGDYEVCDLLEARKRGRIPEDYYVNWGFEDEKLYEWAKEELLLLAEGEEPFHFAMLTADTHSPSGYVCRLCPDIYEKELENAMLCTSKQLDDFLTWCSEQSFYDQTTIVVLGDHASMAPGFYQKEVLDTHSGNTDRKVYNAFINADAEPVQEEGRLFTTLDFFPTTLAAMGVKIEGERLGIGTNLFSGEQTLAEKYGYDDLFGELEKDSAFYNEKIMFP